MTRRRTPGLSHLNASSTRTNDGTSLALDVHLLIGPEGRMVDHALEQVDVLPLGHVALGREPGGDDQVFGFGGAAVGGFDVPAAFVGVELGFGYNAVEGGVALDVEDFVAVVEVLSELLHKASMKRANSQDGMGSYLVIWVVVWPVVSVVYCQLDILT